MPPIKPDAQDFEAVARQFGDLPENASEQRADHYLLAQATKLLRLYDHGKLPLKLMREIDEISRKGGR
jgi:hypothetical protein